MSQHPGTVEPFPLSSESTPTEFNPLFSEVRELFVWWTIHALGLTERLSSLVNLSASRGGWGSDAPGFLMTCKSIMVVDTGATSDSQRDSGVVLVAGEEVTVDVGEGGGLGAGTAQFLPLDVACRNVKDDLEGHLWFTRFHPSGAEVAARLLDLLDAHFPKRTEEIEALRAKLAAAVSVGSR